MQEERQQLHGRLGQEVETLKAEFDTLLAAERTRAQVASHRVVQEHLAVQAQRHAEELKALLAQKEAVVRATTEADVRLQYGEERAARIVALQRLLVRLKTLETVMADHVEAERVSSQTYTLLMATDACDRAIASAGSVVAQVRATLSVPRSACVCPYLRVCVCVCVCVSFFPIRPGHLGRMPVR